jgi:hypothetical protein
MDEVDIRPERPEDAAAIGALVAAAFGPDDDTADFVQAVREEAQVCLAEVALADARIVGHAQWCDAPIVVDGRRVLSAYLTCLSAAPALQRRGSDRAWCAGVCSASRAGDTRRRPCSATRRTTAGSASRPSWLSGSKPRTVRAVRGFKRSSSSTGRCEARWCAATFQP